VNRCAAGFAPPFRLVNVALTARRRRLKVLGLEELRLLGGIRMEPPAAEGSRHLPT
jgi:hypothetical protein